MNFKKHAQRLEDYLEDEVKKELPVALMQDGSLVYKSFRIKKNKKGLWNLYRIGGNLIDSFNLKACALMAAKCYSYNRLSAYNEVKILDNVYQNNINDSLIFKYRYNTSKDVEKRDLALWRWEVTDSRAKRTKHQIASKFNTMF